MPTDTPTPLDLEALKTLAEQATPGPRRIANVQQVGRSRRFTVPDRRESELTVAHVPGVGVLLVDTSGGQFPWADAQYLAAAQPSTVLALLSALGAFREEIAQMRDAYSADTRLACAYTEVLARLDARVRLPEK